MLSIEAVFYGFMLLFGLIGITRGWVRELVASAGIMLGIFILRTLVVPAKTPTGEEVKVFFLAKVLEPFTPSRNVVADKKTLLVIEILSFIIVVFFAYYGPTIVGFKARTGGVLQRMREGVPGVVLGFLVGMLNGYLIAGTLWYLVKEVGYDVVPAWVFSPQLSDTAKRIAESWLPLKFLQGFRLYALFALVLLFVFVAVM